MDIRKLGEENKNFSFIVENTTSGFMNTLRRTIMSHTQCLAIDSVRISSNDSVIFDEMLAHRLGLIPLTTPSDYKKTGKLKLVLEKKGPGEVFSKDIKSADTAVHPIAEDILITKLRDNEEVRMEMEARMGIGKEHSKWQPAIVSYSEILTLKNTKKPQLIKKVQDSCPEIILQTQGNKIRVTDRKKCIACSECRDLFNDKDTEVNYENKNFILYIEPIGQMELPVIIDKSIDAIEEKLDSLEKELKKIA